MLELATSERERAEMLSLLLLLFDKNKNKKTVKREKNGV